MDLKITPSGQTIVKPTALGPGANTDTKLLIYGLFQKGRVLAQDAVGVDLRAVRTFRLLRLIRILKLARYSAAVRRLHRTAIIVREELVLFLNVALILIFLSAVGIYYFESGSQPEHFASVFHSLWWAIVTLTTVGYGDVFPITIGGRVFTFFVLFLGLGIVAVPTGLFASALSKAREEEEDAHGPH